MSAGGGRCGALVGAEAGKIDGNAPSSTSISGRHFSAGVLRTFCSSTVSFGFTQRIRGSSSFTNCLGTRAQREHACGVRRRRCMHMQTRTHRAPMWFIVCPEKEMRRALTPGSCSFGAAFSLETSLLRRMIPPGSVSERAGIVPRAGGGRAEEDEDEVANTQTRAPPPPWAVSAREISGICLCYPASRRAYLQTYFTPAAYIC